MKKKYRRNTACYDSSSEKTTELRQLIATETARIYINEHFTDLRAAKLKAADRLACHNKHDLPSNEEVEHAIKAYQRLFSSNEEIQKIKQIQQTAVTAMEFFESFRPRIVGALANGSTKPDSTIYLHLFTDHAEEVDWLLMEKRLPHDAFNKVYYVNQQKKSSVIPAYRFIADEIPVELAVFPEITLRQQVRCSPKGRPITRCNLAKFKQSITCIEYDDHLSFSQKQ